MISPDSSSKDSKLKIGILGSRGIPNAYGGFEQFAQSLALYLVGRGHKVTVYNSSLHPNRQKVWNGINIVSRFDPENKIGTAGQFIYDLNCILHSRKAGFDILLQLGYTSSAIWSFLLPKGNTRIVTNMDGLEWKRSKYSPSVQTFLKWSERRAANSSDQLVADSIGIQKYLKEELDMESEYIAYGAGIFESPDSAVPQKYGLNPDEYLMLIARMEPENNIETILEGYSKSNSEYPFIVIGGTSKPYGKYIRDKFESERIIFPGGIYNQDDLSSLRYFSNLYFHGHSVGGTNPSLLEAMASSAFICAHDNLFNKSILGSNALYFKNSDDVKKCIERDIEDKKQKISGNLEKISKEFSEDYINSRYERLFMELCAAGRNE